MNQQTSPWQIALLHPLNLAMLALAVAAGLCAAWWLFPVGLALWLLMVYIHQSDRHLRLRLVMHNREALAQRLQGRFDRIERIQVSLYNSLTSAPRRTRKLLQPVQDAMNGAADRVHAFCVRLTALENYRVVQKARGGQGELQVLEDQIARALDPRVKAEYEEARQALQHRLENLERLSAYMDRVDAQLAGLEVSLENVMTQAVSLQATNPQQAASQVEGLVQSIGDQLTQLAKTEGEISELQMQNR